VSSWAGEYCARRRASTTKRPLEHQKSSRATNLVTSVNAAQYSVDRRQRGRSNTKIPARVDQEASGLPRVHIKTNKRGCFKPPKGQRSPTDRPRATSASAPTYSQTRLSRLRQETPSPPSSQSKPAVNTQHQERPLQNPKRELRNPTDRPKATSASAPTHSQTRLSRLP
jgi:hypothetical protein